MGCTQMWSKNKSSMPLDPALHAKLTRLGFVPSPTQPFEYVLDKQRCVVTSVCSGHIEVFLGGDVFLPSTRAAVASLTSSFKKDAILFTATFELTPKLLPTLTHRMSSHDTPHHHHALFYPRSSQGVEHVYKLPFTCSAPPYLLDHRGSLSAHRHGCHVTIHFTQPIVIWHPSCLCPDLPLWLDTKGMSFRNVRINKKKYFASWYKIPIPSSVYWFQNFTVHIVNHLIVNTCADFNSAYAAEYGELRTFCLAVLMHVDHQARVIQRAWRRSISDPSYAVCKKRLLKEYHHDINRCPL